MLVLRSKGITVNNDGNGVREGKGGGGEGEGETEADSRNEQELDVLNQIVAIKDMRPC